MSIPYTRKIREFDENGSFKVGVVCVIVKTHPQISSLTQIQISSHIEQIGSTSVI